MKVSLAVTQIPSGIFESLIVFEEKRKHLIPGESGSVALGLGSWHFLSVLGEESRELR